MTDLEMERVASVSKVDFAFSSQIVEAGRIGHNIMSYFAIFGIMQYILPLFNIYY